jgi:hypothetical protein
VKGAPPSEHKLQVALTDYLMLAGRSELHWFAIPNGEKRHIRVAQRLKNEGVRRGTPDLCFLLPGGKVGWLEMKTAKGSLSEHQKVFRDKALALGHAWAMARTIDEALAFLTSIDALKPAYQRGEAFRQAAQSHLNLARVLKHETAGAQ